MNEYEMYTTYNDQGLQLAMLQQQHYMQPQTVSITPLTTTASAAASNSTQRQSVKALTKSETPAERSTRRKQATQREKRRMEKLNHCIEDIKQIVCPEMKVFFFVFFYFLIIHSKISKKKFTWYFREYLDSFWTVSQHGEKLKKKLKLQF